MKKIKEENKKRKNLNKNIKLKNNKAITLIALVITIVVLIILAGVAINLTLGDNGIFNKAKLAKEQYNMASIKEKLDIAILEIQADEVSEARNLTLDTLLTKLPTKLEGIEITKEGNTIKGTYDGYDFVIGENFEVTIEGYNPSEGEGGGSEPQPPVATTYNVTFNGSNVTSNGANTVNKSATYTATLTLTSGYGVSNIVVKMGGATLAENTNYTYSDINRTITIPNVSGDVEISIETLETVASKKTAELTYFDSEKTLVDSNRNIVKVPQGFKIAEDSGINITEGIVIEDNDIKTGIGNNRGNQYVWIPVGTGLKKSDGSTVNIELGRYMFADGTNHKGEDGNTPLAVGTPILMQSAKNYENETEIHITDEYPTSTSDYGWKELKDYRAGVASSGLDGLNATALNLKGFIDSVEANGGYYIARYEASYGEDGKANSKISNTFTDATTAPTAEGQLWNNITQINASIASKNLYTTINSDLMNSYAWDTAIVYIQEFSGDTDYSKQTSLNTSLANTGANGDEVCKINDIASNTIEWTTEYTSHTTNDGAQPCTNIGGTYFLSSYYYVSGRVPASATHSSDSVAFRSALYM